ncbi:hypothetical protein RR46_08642 [Papilio xuthus]|uniref:Uncharacterized protein n=1 Tax=Papilio xuthus TaxID=66420 RepID=A0A194Q9D6_PAPXU|nr:hypothetical protein RR46_08642 [Papilio xuthus]
MAVVDRSTQRRACRRLREGMSGRGAGGQRCQLILQRCLAIHLSKPGNAPDDFWMYDSGYLLFQFISMAPKSRTFQYDRYRVESKERTVAGCGRSIAVPL